MGHKNRNTGGTLRDQVYNRLQGKRGFGRSKSEDKRNGISSRYIYSFNSMKTYMKHCFYFVEWCKASPDIRAAMIIASQNLGHNRESVVGEHYLRLSK